VLHAETRAAAALQLALVEAASAVQAAASWAVRSGVDVAQQLIRCVSCSGSDSDSVTGVEAFLNTAIPAGVTTSARISSETVGLVQCWFSGDIELWLRRILRVAPGDGCCIGNERIEMGG
jgi:hypothetical protein